MSALESHRLSFLPLLWPTLPFVVVLLASSQPLLLDIGYSKLHQEFWFVGLISILLGGVFGMISVWLPWLGQVIFALFFYSFCDLFFFDNSRLAYFLAITFVIICLSPARQTFMIFATVFGAVFLITSMLSGEFDGNHIPKSAVKSQETISIANPDLPTIVHLIVDEFGAPTLTPEPPEHKGTGSRLEADYVSRGFAIFRHTRATTDSSKDSLADLFAATKQASVKTAVKGKKNSEGPGFYVPKNVYFKRMRDLGYHIKVWQSTYLDMCGQYTIDCRFYDVTNRRLLLKMNSSDPFERVANALRAVHKAAYLGGVRGVRIYRVVIKWFRKRLGVVVDLEDAGAQITVLEVMDEIENSLQSAKRGELYFAHLLLPHFTWVFDRNCKLRPSQEWGFPLHSKGNKVGIDYSSYFEQMRCTHSRVMQLIRVIDNHLPRGSIIVVHGDHGVRMHKGVGHVASTKDSEAIVSDSLDTLFAIRAEGVVPGVVLKEGLLPARFHELLEAQIRLMKRK